MLRIQLYKDKKYAQPSSTIAIKTLLVGYTYFELTKKHGRVSASFGQQMEWEKKFLMPLCREENLNFFYVFWGFIERFIHLTRICNPGWNVASISWKSSFHKHMQQNPE